MGNCYIEVLSENEMYSIMYRILRHFLWHGGRLHNTVTIIMASRLSVRLSVTFVSNRRI